MGIMNRMKDIIASEVNSVFDPVLDKTEDPIKMVDQYVRNLDSDLQKIRAKELVLASEEKNAKRRLEECQREIAKLEKYETMARENDHMEDAEVFAEAIRKTQADFVELSARVEEASENTQKIHEMYESLKKEVRQLEARSNEMKAKARVANAMEMNKQYATASSEACIQKTTEDIDKFVRLENDINSRLEMAKSQLEKANDEVQELEKKYEDMSKAEALEKELEEMKEE